MKYKSCITEQDYKDKAEACLKGITKIKEILSKVESPKKRAELAVKFEDDIKVLEKTYCECRKQYDPDFVYCGDGE